MNRQLGVVVTCAFALAGCSDQGGITDFDGDPDFGRGGKGYKNASAAAAHTYEVTIENLTSGQPLSPGVIVTHTKKQHIFRPGEAASEGIQLIAENGDPSVAEGDLSGASGVNDVVATSVPVGCVGCPGPFGSTMTVQIEAKANANRLSLALMLICTNDGFAGLDGVKLPGGFRSRTFYAFGYDAGTEANDELWDSIVDPCGGIGPVPGPQDMTNDRPETADVVAAHPGIMNVGDLTMAHEWDEPVAKVTVRRIKK